MSLDKLVHTIDQAIELNRKCNAWRYALCICDNCLRKTEEVRQLKDHGLQYIQQQLTNLCYCQRHINAWDPLVKREQEDNKKDTRPRLVNGSFIVS
jgi:hypothetical protein